MSMVPYERDLLRHLNGEDVPGISWGAGMGAAIEYLKGRGFVRGVMRGDALHYEITESGRAALQGSGQEGEK